MGVTSNEDEALLALETLGYSRSEVYLKIRKIIQESESVLTTEQLIKKALQK
ncbi:MAG: hypothetical protein K9M55_02940 [Candidatus Marinimicrobia bacterium]|nr:hypothetical protein [Candidatus Neomarinimicrobiota bacterium]